MSSVNKFLIGTDLDEIGLRYTLKRFENEEIYDYKRRLDFVIKVPPKNNLESFLTYSNISLGYMEKNIIKLIKVKDEINFRIKIDSCFIFIYKVSNEQFVLYKKINYNEEIKYIKEFLSILDTIDFIDYELPLEEDIDYLDVFNLKIQDNLKYKRNLVLPSGKVNNIGYKNLVNVFSNTRNVFVYRKNSLFEVIAEGDYYIDLVEGIIFTYLPINHSVDIEYLEMPFYLKWQPVKSYLFNDESIDFLLKDNLLIDGELKRKELNKKGNDIVNSILEIDPLYWGE